MAVEPLPFAELIELAGGAHAVTRR
jgi:hypothetical protein